MLGCIFDASTGQIKSIYTGPFIEAQVKEGESHFIGEVDQNAHYILSTAQLAVLTTQQLSNLTTSQLPGLTSSGVDALTPMLANRPVQAITLNKTILTADGIDNIIISNAMPGSTITVKGNLPGNTATGTCANPDTFTTEIADTYIITISLWPYLDFVTTITAS